MTTTTTTSASIPAPSATSSSVVSEQQRIGTGVPEASSRNSEWSRRMRARKGKRPVIPKSKKERRRQLQKFIGIAKKTLKKVSDVGGTYFLAVYGEDGSKIAWHCPHVFPEAMHLKGPMLVFEKSMLNDLAKSLYFSVMALAIDKAGGIREADSILLQAREASREAIGVSGRRWVSMDGRELDDGQQRLLRSRGLPRQFCDQNNYRDICSILETLANQSPTPQDPGVLESKSAESGSDLLSNLGPSDPTHEETLTTEERCQQAREFGKLYQRRESEIRHRAITQLVECWENSLSKLLEKFESSALKKILFSKAVEKELSKLNCVLEHFGDTHKRAPVWMKDHIVAHNCTPTQKGCAGFYFFRYKHPRRKDFFFNSSIQNVVEIEGCKRVMCWRWVKLDTMKEAELRSCLFALFCRMYKHRALMDMLFQAHTELPKMSSLLKFDSGTSYWFRRTIRVCAASGMMSEHATSAVNGRAQTLEETRALAVAGGAGAEPVASVGLPGSSVAPGSRDTSAGENPRGEESTGDSIQSTGQMRLVLEGASAGPPIVRTGPAQPVVESARGASAAGPASAAESVPDAADAADAAEPVPGAADAAEQVPDAADAADAADAETRDPGLRVGPHNLRPRKGRVSPRNLRPRRVKRKRTSL
jgi:hypothetical protein